MLKIVGNKLTGDGVVWRSTTKTSGKMTPKFLVIHYSAGTTFAGDMAILSSPNPAKVSAQIVIGPEGEIGAIGFLNDALWQAGESSWKGYTGLNRHSIGIEVTCPGWLTDKGNGKAAMYTGRVLVDGSPWPFVQARHRNPRENATLWAGFNERQIASLIEVGELLMDHYDLQEAVGHDQIAPLRKIDPGPCCPASVFARLNGNAEDEAKPERPDLPVVGLVRVKGVAPERLTFRASPNGDPIGLGMVENQQLEKLGVSGNWTQVRTPSGVVGYVWSAFLANA